MKTLRSFLFVATVAMTLCQSSSAIPFPGASSYVKPGLAGLTCGVISCVVLPNLILGPFYKSTFDTITSRLVSEHGITEEKAKNMATSQKINQIYSCLEIGNVSSCDQASSKNHKEQKLVYKKMFRIWSVASLASLALGAVCGVLLYQQKCIKAQSC